MSSSKSSEKDRLTRGRSSSDSNQDFGAADTVEAEGVSNTRADMDDKYNDRSHLLTQMSDEGDKLAEGMRRLGQAETVINVCISATEKLLQVLSAVDPLTPVGHAATAINAVKEAALAVDTHRMLNVLEDLRRDCKSSGKDHDDLDYVIGKLNHLRKSHGLATVPIVGTVSSLSNKLHALVKMKQHSKGKARTNWAQDIHENAMAGDATCKSIMTTLIGETRAQQALKAADGWKPIYKAMNK